MPCGLTSPLPVLNPGVILLLPDTKTSNWALRSADRRASVFAGRARNVVSAVTLGCFTLGQLPLAAISATSASAQSGTTTSIMTRAEYEACQTSDESAFRTAIEKLTLKGLTVGEKVIVEGVQKLRPGGAVCLAPPEAAAPYLN